MWPHRHVGTQMLLLLMASVEPRESATFFVHNPAIKNVPHSFQAQAIPLAEIFRRSALPAKHPTALQYRDRRGRARPPGASPGAMRLSKNSLGRSCGRGGTSPGNRKRILGRSRDIPPQYPKCSKESIRRRKLWIWTVFLHPMGHMVGVRGMLTTTVPCARWVLACPRPGTLARSRPSSCR